MAPRRPMSRTLLGGMILLPTLGPGCILVPEDAFDGDRIPNRAPRAWITGGVLSDSSDSPSTVHFN